MAKSKRDAQITGNVGLYYVCYRLSVNGWNVMPTARNARGIDIVAYDRSGQEFLGIQVKALSTRNAVPLGSDIDKVMGDFWVIVINVHDSPSAFIMTPQEVKHVAQKNEKAGAVSYWLEPRSYNVDEYREAWQRIQLPDQQS